MPDPSTPDLTDADELARAWAKYPAAGAMFRSEGILARAYLALRLAPSSPGAREVTHTEVAKACAIFSGEWNRFKGQGDEPERAMRAALIDFVTHRAASPASPGAPEKPSASHCVWRLRDDTFTSRCGEEWTFGEDIRDDYKFCPKCGKPILHTRARDSVSEFDATGATPVGEREPLEAAQVLARSILRVVDRIDSDNEVWTAAASEAIRVGDIRAVCKVLLAASPASLAEGAGRTRITDDVVEMAVHDADQNGSAGSHRWRQAFAFALREHQLAAPASSGPRVTEDTERLDWLEAQVRADDAGEGVGAVTVMRLASGLRRSGIDLPATWSIGRRDVQCDSFRAAIDAARAASQSGSDR